MRADCFARATVLIGLLCVGGLSGPQGAAAQGLSLSGVAEDRPIEVSADHGIEWQQDAQVYIARGNAMAKRGATEVHADTLTAHYRPSKGTGDKGTGDKGTGDKGTGDKGTGDKGTGDKGTGDKGTGDK